MQLPNVNKLQAASPSLKDRKRSSSMPKVLFAEDDDAVREMLWVSLERDGFEVIAVANVCEALNRIATETFDVLLRPAHAASRRWLHCRQRYAPYPSLRCDTGAQRLPGVGRSLVRYPPYRLTKSL